MCSLVWTAITEFSELGLMFNYFFDPAKYLHTQNVDTRLLESKPYGINGKFDTFHTNNQNYGIIEDTYNFLHSLQGPCQDNIGPYGRFKRPMIVEILQFALFRWKMRPFTIKEVLLSIATIGVRSFNPNRNCLLIGTPIFDNNGITSLNGVRFCEEVLYNIGILKKISSYKKFENFKKDYKNEIINYKNEIIFVGAGVVCGYVYSLIKKENKITHLRNVIFGGSVGYCIISCVAHLLPLDDNLIKNRHHLVIKILEADNDHRFNVVLREIFIKFEDDKCESDCFKLIGIDNLEESNYQVDSEKARRIGEEHQEEEMPELYVKGDLITGFNKIGFFPI